MCNEHDEKTLSNQIPSRGSMCGYQQLNKEDIGMSSKLVEEMLDKVNSANNPDHEPTVKIDKETYRIVNKWNVGSLRATVKMMCEIADEALEKEKQQKNTPSQ